MAWFHRHDWQDVSLAHLYNSYYAGYLFGGRHIGDEPITVVTQRCGSCSKYRRQQTLKGHV